MLQMDGCIVQSSKLVRSCADVPAQLLQQLTIGSTQLYQQAILARLHTNVFLMLLFLPMYVVL